MGATIALVWGLGALLACMLAAGGHRVSFTKQDDAADDAAQAKWIDEWAAR